MKTSKMDILIGLTTLVFIITTVVVWSAMMSSIGPQTHEEAGWASQQFRNITEFPYNGHDYIYFEVYQGGGVVHSPECSCLKTKEN